MTFVTAFPKVLLLLSIFFLLSSCQSSPTLNLRPIVGILTQPSDYPDVFPPDEYSYLPASYVKFVEAGGSRAVAVQYDLPLENLTNLFSYLNGWVFTGGDQPLVFPNGSFTQYGQTASTILTWAINATQNGIYTPVWGTCEGFQYLAYLISQNYSIYVEPGTLSNVAMNLTWNTTTYGTSRTFQNLPSDLYFNVQTDQLVYFNADYTIDPNGWSENTNLASTFSPIAYVPTSNGTFVAYIEGTTLPLYGSQFHPEKVTFEWNELENIPHEFDAIRFEQFLGNFFINETRLNYNQFPNETYAALFVIENFNTTVLNESSFQQIYVFENLNFTGTESKVNINPSLISYLAANPVWVSPVEAQLNDEL